MVTIKITGANGPERFRDIQQIVGQCPIAVNVPFLFVDCPSRERANLAVVNLNQIPGVRACIVE